MKAFTLLASAAVVAAALAAQPAQAAVFAQFSPNTGDADFRWIRSAGLGTNGHLFSIVNPASTVAQAAATHFTFLDPALSALVFLPSTFKLDANVVTTPAINNGGGPAHTACLGFGLERITLALFRAHGFDVDRWPATAREELGIG